VRLEANGASQMNLSKFELAVELLKGLDRVQFLQLIKVFGVALTPR